jgi:hypothetical protein
MTMEQQAAIVSKYLVRIWPEGSEPPAMRPSEMSCPESTMEGQPANDRAMAASVRAWAVATARSEGVPYRFEVLSDSIVDALNGGTQRTRRRVTEPIATGIASPGGEITG